MKRFRHFDWFRPLCGRQGYRGQRSRRSNPELISTQCNSIRRETMAASTSSPLPVPGPIRTQRSGRWQWGQGVRLVQCRERLAGGAAPRSDRPSLLSSEWKNCCRRWPAFASLVWRGLYWRQLENINSTSEMYSPGDRDTRRERDRRHGE